MSQKEKQPVSRKEKKAQRDAERQKKGKKRKRDESEENREEDVAQNEFERDFIPLNDGIDDGQVLRKAASAEPEGEHVQRDGKANDDASSRKRKKRKKAKDDAKGEKQHTEGENVKPTTISNKERRPRFILFIGNLPYTTTDASLHMHFKKLSPFTLRHRTDPKTKKSKGFAFLEFENYDRMKTCLKLYHHSMFDPAKTTSSETGTGEEGVQAQAEKDGGAKKRKEKGARRINVELTAGGGGKTEGRQEKIKVKNERLEGQRKRRIEEELKAREKEKAKKNKKVGAESGADATAGKKSEVVVGGGEDDHTAGMHPSRLARMKR